MQQAVNTNLFFGRPVASTNPSPRFALRKVAWLVSLSCNACAVYAQTASVPIAVAVQMAATSLKEVVVSGSRSEQTAEDLPMTIDVINARDMEAGQMHDIRDVVRDIPNVSVKRAPARFSLAGNSTFLVYSLSQQDGGTRVGLMLLAGIAINALAGASLGFLTFLATDE